MAIKDRDYTTQEAADSMGVGQSTMSKWVRQLKEEREGIPQKASPMTPEQIKIRAYEKSLARDYEETESLKKATALLISDSMRKSR